MTSGVIEINWGPISITGESDQRGGDIITHIPLNLMFLSYFQYIEINAVIPVYTVQLLKQVSKSFYVSYTLCYINDYYVIHSTLCLICLNCLSYNFLLGIELNL